MTDVWQKRWCRGGKCLLYFSGNRKLHSCTQESLSSLETCLVLLLLAPCQWGSHPDSHAYKLIVILQYDDHHQAPPQVWRPQVHKRPSSQHTNRVRDATQIIVRCDNRKLSARQCIHQDHVMILAAGTWRQTEGERQLIMRSDRQGGRQLIMIIDR